MQPPRPRVGLGAAHLFTAGKPNIDRLAGKALHPHWANDMSGLSDEQKNCLNGQSF
ncbi:MAG TPA: hypothetical protein VFB59_02820 [Candidatus Saccharimonadales bacterium]|nr:hypothetical protein [Candidatus Saccharimonadales bacterium]